MLGVCNTPSSSKTIASIGDRHCVTGGNGNCATYATLPSTNIVKTTIRTLRAFDSHGLAEWAPRHSHRR